MLVIFGTFGGFMLISFLILGRTTNGVRRCRLKLSFGGYAGRSAARFPRSFGMHAYLLFGRCETFRCASPA